MSIGVVGERIPVPRRPLLMPPPALRSLDAKLGKALKEVVEQGREAPLRYLLDRLDEEALNARPPYPLTGRRCLYEILSYFKIADGLSLWRSMRDLHDLRWKGDRPKGMGEFAHEATILAQDAIGEGYPAEAVYSVLHEKLRESKVLAHRMAVHNLVGPSKTWESLLGLMWDHLEEERRDQRNRDSRKPAGGAPPGSSDDAPAPKAAAPKPPPPVKAPPPYPPKAAPPAPPAASDAKPWLAVFDEFPGVCRAHFHSSSCRLGDKCRFKHEGVSKRDAARIRSAVDQQRASSADRPRRNSPGPSPTSVSGASDDEGGGRRKSWPIGLCHLHKEGKCTAGADCRWRHAPTKAEMDRVKAVRKRARDAAAGVAVA